MAAGRPGCCSYFLVGKFTFLLLIFTPVSILAVCRFGRFENGCALPCNCQSGDKCHSDTGCEVGSCQQDIHAGGPFSGEGCQIGNLAFRKSASQVGTYNGMVANRSVDGYVDGENNHCSHPLGENGNNAWWMVDLGDNYAISSVTIYSGTKGDGNNFLRSLLIGIGDSPTVDGHNECATHSEIKNKEIVTLPCERTGRYISIKKGGGDRKDAMFLCEVVVKGYKYRDCTSACKGSCNHFTGCDKCEAGKKMPDCKQDCDRGTYGINCAESCSQHCVDSGHCDRVTGSCSGGCQQWYGLNTCKAQISKVDYVSTPTVGSVTSSSVSLSWPQSRQVPSGLESYYQYVVEASDGQGTKQLVAGQDRTMEITDLKHNTKYYIKVRIDAKYKKQTKQGTAGPTVEVKTKCTPPAKPNVPSVTTTDLYDSHLGSLHVNWQAPGDSGCDNFHKVLVQYKLTSSGQWLDKEAGVADTQTIIDNLKSGNYNVRLSVTNNEDIESVSDTTTYTIGRATTLTTTTTTPKGATTAKSTDPNKKGGDSTTIIIGVVITLIVLIILVIIVIIFRLRKGDEICKRSKRHDSQPPAEHVDAAPARNEQPAVCVVQQEVEQEEQEVEEVARVVPIPEEGIYQNLVHVSTLVSVDKLEAYIKERDTITDGFVPEYNNLPRTDLTNVKAGKRPPNVPLNRFKNIWPYDHSRVKLSVDEDNPSDYINACYITGYKGKAKAYIACQGPRQNTLSDMWRMIWQLKINRIVMVTQLSEHGRRKCDIYWPLTVGTQKVYGKVTVANLSCDVYADYTIRTFELTCQGRSHKVTHFQYTSWMDKGVPKDTYPLLSLRRLIRSHDSRSSGPMVVHCSAGIGRTGTFIALDSLLDQAKAENQVDVYRFVNSMRAERMEMVQTQIQYVFLYHALLDGHKTGQFACPESQYSAAYKRLCKDDSNLTELREQFQMLETLKPKPPGPSSAALLKTNMDKNRSLEIIPADNSRPYLMSRSPGTNDYINAVYVDSYRRRSSFLLTEIPQQNTVVDFWRLILDHQCPTIIMLDDSEEAYWPDEEDPVMTHGTLTVKLLSERNATIQNVVEREVKVYLTATPEHSHKVKQYQLASGWPCRSEVPSDSNAFMNLVELANRPVSEDESGGPTILQCMDGASRCGLFCAATHLLGSLSIDQYVDVFHSTQHVRNNRRQAISSLEQYKFLHKLVIDYRGQHATYYNL